jgi:hypothetical protein
MQSGVVASMGNMITSAMSVLSKGKKKHMTLTELEKVLRLVRIQAESYTLSKVPRTHSHSHCVWLLMSCSSVSLAPEYSLASILD